MIDGKRLILGRTFATGAPAWLRCEQHLNAIARADKALCPVLAPGDDVEEAWKAECLADVFVSNVSRPPDSMFRTVEMWTSRGKPWVWDVDDDPLTISPHNPAYVCFGTEEVRLDPPVNGKEWLWKDGEESYGARFDLADNRRRSAAYLKMLREHVTAITTTTDYLAEKLRKIAPDTPIYLRPNVLDFKEVWTMKRRPATDGFTRIVYQGGSSHYADLGFVLPALAQIAKDFPKVKFLFIGDTKAHAEKMIDPDRIESYEWTGDYPSFAQRMALLGPDIAIAPLCMDEAHAEFARCKSALKWLDAAALGIPCVCQWDLPFTPVVNFSGTTPSDEWNGMLARTEQDWYDCLAALLMNRDRAEQIGATAYAEARNYWNVDEWVDTYLKQYEEIIRHGDSRQHHPVGDAIAAR